MITVKRGPTGTLVYIGAVLVDHKNKTNQNFTQLHIVKHADDPEDCGAVNAEIVYILRKQFEQIMRNLEYIIKEQKRPEYLIEFSEGEKGYTVKNNSASER